MRIARARRSAAAGAEPLPPRRKWRAILLATLLFVPGYWAMIAGFVSVASDRADPVAGPFIAFGLAIVPFVFVVLAFLSEHPRAGAAVVKAMVLSLLVGIPISAVSADAVTGVVAGLGAGGIAALRADEERAWKTRALAVALAAAWTFLTLRTATEVALLLAPALPFTAIGVADHLLERRRERAAAAR